MSSMKANIRLPRRPNQVLISGVLVLGGVAWAGSSEVAPSLASLPEPKVERHVSEDDQVRVEELRVRGESQRIVVKLKGSAGREYDIVPSTGASDPSQRLKAPAGSALWRLLSF